MNVISPVLLDNSGYIFVMQDVGILFDVLLPIFTLARKEVNLIEFEFRDLFPGEISMWISRFSMRRQ